MHTWVGPREPSSQPCNTKRSPPTTTSTTLTTNQEERSSAPIRQTIAPASRSDNPIPAPYRPLLLCLVCSWIPCCVTMVVHPGPPEVTVATTLQYYSLTHNPLLLEFIRLPCNMLAHHPITLPINKCLFLFPMYFPLLLTPSYNLCNRRPDM